jgi:6-phosphogluconolactonase
MITLTKFPSCDQLDKLFAEHVAQLLKQAIAEKGEASLAVSGGTTPKGFFNALSLKALAWDKVTITLTDERWVDEDSPDSNTRLVKENLLQNNALKANFFSLKVSSTLTSNTLDYLTTQAQHNVLPFDVLILGMGADGHTASLFPCSDNISAALSLTNKQMLMAITPKTAPYQRITFTLPALLASKNIFLHLCGETKLNVLTEALQDTNTLVMPIRAFLHHPTIITQIMWAKQ